MLLTLTVVGTVTDVQKRQQFVIMKSEAQPRGTLPRKDSHSDTWKLFEEQNPANTSQRNGYYIDLLYHVIMLCYIIIII